MGNSRCTIGPRILPKAGIFPIKVTTVSNGWADYGAHGVDEADGAEWATGLEQDQVGAS
jgi:hypothetical protein